MLIVPLALLAGYGVVWPGKNLPPDDVSYWHQMGITIYCNPANCPVDTNR
jgi:hypothetical protein